MGEPANAVRLPEPAEFNFLSGSPRGARVACLVMTLNLPHHVTDESSVVFTSQAESL